MFKYICALSVLLSGYSFSAVNNNDMGLYRDNNYNVLALAGGYNCGVYSLPKNIENIDDYNNVRIGSATVEITPYSGDNSVMVNVNLDTGVTVTSPRLPAVNKSSTGTIYAVKNEDLFFMYGATESEGIGVFIQDERKGSEKSLRIAGCKYADNKAP